MATRGHGSEDRLLDAARDCVLAVGLRRTTLTDVARRAGVSRMTMYRRWADMGALMSDLMTREWGRLAVAAFDEAAGENGRERLVDALTRGVRALRDHAMFRRVVEVNPEVLLPYLFERRGSVQEMILAQAMTALRDGQADGSVRDGDPATLARALLLTAHGFVFSASTMTDQVGEKALDEEFRLLLERYLRP